MRFRSRIYLFTPKEIMKTSSYVMVLLGSAGRRCGSCWWRVGWSSVYGAAVQADWLTVVVSVGWEAEASHSHCGLSPALGWQMSPSLICKLLPVMLAAEHSFIMCLSLCRSASDSHFSSLKKKKTSLFGFLDQFLWTTFPLLFHVVSCVSALP